MSPDLNPIENVWSLMVHELEEELRQPARQLNQDELWAAVVLNDDSDADKALRRLRAHAQAALTRTSRPRRYLTLEALPRTPRLLPRAGAASPVAYPCC